jgi:4-hydroxy-tetrahydrodipicolinate reductase
MGARTCSLACDDPRFGLVTQIDLESNTIPANNAGTPIDAVIDFSSDDGARNAVRIALEHHAAVLVGTTGLSRQTLADIEVATRTIAVMVAPNTSLGIAVMNHLAAVTAGLLGPRFGVNLIEVHHTQKRDAPSGTALRIADTLRRAGAELPADCVHAIRSGDVIGEHTVEFAGGGERVRISHAATSRDLFVRGALEAIAWLHGRPPGRYTIEQSLGLGSA